MCVPWIAANSPALKITVASSPWILSSQVLPEKATPIGRSRPNTIGLSDLIPTTDMAHSRYTVNASMLNGYLLQFSLSLLTTETGF